MNQARIAAWTVLALSLFSLPSLAAPLKIMAMGDSITYGVDYLTQSTGGYRDPLLQDLNAAGISFTFVGANNSNATLGLTAAGQTQHNGFGSWHIQDLNNNLEGVADPKFGGDSNAGGYLLTGGHGTGRGVVNPDILLLHIGTNDLLQGSTSINQDLYTLVTHFHSLSPNTVILIAGVIPINGSSLMTATQTYNTYIKNTLVPALPYTMYVDQNTAFLNDDSSVNAELLGADNVHPDRFGYPIMAYKWATAIEQITSTNATTYNLTVTGGKGTGYYPAGSVLTIRAGAAANGSQFAAWLPSTTALGNPYSQLTTFVTPANPSTLTANYAGTGSPMIPDGTYEISSLYDNLSIGSAASSDGSSAQQQSYAGSANQKWILSNLGGNVVTLKLSGTGEALEVPSSSANTLTANLDIASYTGGVNQQWNLTSYWGATQLVNVGSGLAVYINGNSVSSGSPLVQYTAASYSEEMWRFYPLGAAYSAAPATYALTVKSGSGSGTYAPGTMVNVAANAIAGYQFVAWTGATSALGNPYSAVTTFTMPSASSAITATYAAVVLAPSPAPPAPSSVGSVVSVQFPQYYADVVVSPLSTNNLTSGVVPVNNWNVANTDTGTSPIFVSTGLMDSNAKTTSLGFSYSGYTRNDGTNNNSFPLPYSTQVGGLADRYLSLGSSFNITGAPETLALSGLDATHTYNLIVYVTSPWWAYGGTDSASVSMGGAKYYIQTSRTLGTWVQANSTNASSATIGNYVLFSNITGASSQTVTITGAYVGLAGFQLIDGNLPATASPSAYSLTVNGGTGSGNYTIGSTVTVTANAPANGYKFSGWTGITGALANAYASTTTLTMPASNSTISATYAPVSAVASPVVTSVQFPQYYNHAVVDPMNVKNYAGGVISAQNWNVANTDTGTSPAIVASGALMDSTGTATTLGFSYSGYTRNDGTNNSSFPAPLWYQTGGLADQYLALGCSFNTTGAVETLLLTGLDATHTYSVVAYVTSPWWANGGTNSAAVTANGNSYYIQTSRTLGAWTQSSSTTPSSPGIGNYVRFTGLTGATAQTITLTGTFVGLAGFQVVDGGLAVGAATPR